MEPEMKADIGIILGSDSDFPIFEKAIGLLEGWGIPFVIEVSSAHRTPRRTVRLASVFEKMGIRVVIAAAGGAAHLAGSIAAHTPLPVLAVPVTSPLLGLDSLLSMVQMPGGVPVATFGIGESGALNAVLFAIEILALNDGKLKKSLERFRREQETAVLVKSRRLKERLNRR
jgi:5-(carboxyamino)imidazole ribonucleotide mutase